MFFSIFACFACGKIEPMQCSDIPINHIMQIRPNPNIQHVHDIGKFISCYALGCII